MTSALPVLSTTRRALPTVVSARSSAIMSRVAASTACCHWPAPNFSAYGLRLCAKMRPRELLITAPRPFGVERGGAVLRRSPLAAVARHQENRVRHGGAQFDELLGIRRPDDRADGPVAGLGRASRRPAVRLPRRRIDRASANSPAVVDERPILKLPAARVRRLHEHEQARVARDRPSSQTAPRLS